MNIIPVVYSVELLCFLMSIPREKENIPHVNKLLSSKAFTSYLSHINLNTSSFTRMPYEISDSGSVW